MAMRTFIGSLSIAASITLTDPIITHFIFTLCLSFAQILALLQSPMWHILSSFPSHFATFEDCLPISTLYTNIPCSQVLMPSSSLQLRSNHLTQMTDLSLHLKCPGYELFSYFFLNGGVWAFICSDVQSSRLPQFSLSSPGFQLNWLKICLPTTSKFICALCRFNVKTRGQLPTPISFVCSPSCSKKQCIAPSIWSLFPGFIGRFHICQ